MSTMVIQYITQERDPLLSRLRGDDVRGQLYTEQSRGLGDQVRGCGLFCSICAIPREILQSVLWQMSVYCRAFRTSRKVEGQCG